jgi:hypothetical protein
MTDGFDLPARRLRNNVRAVLCGPGIDLDDVADAEPLPHGTETDPATR